MRNTLPPLAAAALLLCGGCRTPAPPASALPEREARQAGALALYAKGILLESQEGGDTNAARLAALDAFRQAALLDPANRRPAEALASSLADGGRYADALAALETFLARNPADPQLRLDAARLAESADRPADAARHCAALLAEHPAERDLAHALIRLRFQANQDPLALRAMRDLHARFNDEKSAALPVSWALHFTREAPPAPARSLACLRLALPLRPDPAERAALLAIAAENRLQLGQTNAAETLLLDAYRLNPAVLTPLLRLGALRADRPGAADRLAALARREADPSTTLLLLAATRQALGDHAAAADALTAAYTLRMKAGLFPGENFYLWYATLLEAARRTPDTERLLTGALAVHPSSHEIKNFLAYLWAEQGTRLADADRLVTEALAAQPANAAYLDTKGWILFKKGRLYDALQFLLKAAELEKDEPEILGHAATVLDQLGHAAEAALFRQRAKKLTPH